MRLFILSIYDSGYGATMYENGLKVDLTKEENWIEFVHRFKVAPEQATMKDLQKALPIFTTIIICIDGNIEIGVSFTWKNYLDMR